MKNKHLQIKISEIFENNKHFRKEYLNNYILYYIYNLVKYNENEDLLKSIKLLINIIISLCKENRKLIKKIIDLEIKKNKEVKL